MISVWDHRCIPARNSRSDLPDETNIAKSVESNSQLCSLRCEQGVRQVACWTEMDAGETNPEVRALFINPAEVLANTSTLLS